MRFAIITIIISILLIGPSPVTNHTLSNTLISVDQVEDLAQSTLADLVPHDPILIDNNTDFVALGCPGNGTESNPYLLQDLEIESTNSTYCLRVQWPADAYYTISNCVFSGTYIPEEYPNHIDNGSLDIRGGRATIMNCQIYNSTIGVMLDSPYAKVFNNEICNCSWTNIWAANNFAEIKGNTLTKDGQYSIKCDASNVLIDSNQILRGVHVHRSVQLDLMAENVLVQNNFIEGAYHTFYTHGLGYFFRNNTFEVYNDFSIGGITENVTFVDCTFRNKSRFIQHLNLRYDAVVTGCTFDNFSISLTTTSENITIDSCRFRGWAYVSSPPPHYLTGNIRIRNCTFTGPSSSIYDTNAISANGNTSLFEIANCSMSGYTYGIAGSATNIVVRDTTINDCMLGISYSGIDGLIHDSVILQGEYGIFLQAANSTISNNTIQWNDIGIYTSDVCYNNRIFYNRFISNTLNAKDDGESNTWDNGVSLGNYWSDYDLEGEYEIYGTAGSVDRWPMYIEPIARPTTPIDPTTTTTPTTGLPDNVLVIIIAIGIGGVVVLIVVAIDKFRR